MARQGYYAVRNGANRGVYTSWDECKANVNGYSNAVYKKFSSAEEASNFVNASGAAGESPNQFYSRYNGGSSNMGSSSRSYGSSNYSSSSSSPVTVRAGSSAYVERDEPQHSAYPTGYTQVYPKPYSSSSQSKVQRVYTDGASRGNGRAGAKAGYGVYYGPNDHRNVAEPLAGSAQTNQRAELTAVQHAITDAYRDIQANGGHPSKRYEIVTDSQYSKKAVTEWANKWTQNGWKASTGGEVSNRDIIEPTHAMYKAVDRAYKQAGYGGLNVEHVRGHNGDVGNEAADALANAGVDKYGSGW